MNEKNERSKKKGLQPMKVYPIKQVLESIPDKIGKTPNSLPIFNASRQSPSPSPLQRTKSNESYSSKTSPNSSRGVSPVTSYLQSQWPRDIRQSLLKNDIECQTESSENSEVENCENCLPPPSSNQVKSLTNEGTVLKEMKRIKNMTSVLEKNNIGSTQPDLSVKYPTNAQVKTQYQIHRRSRPPSTESYSDELLGYSDMENDLRFLYTPPDGRRAPRPVSNNSQTQTDSHFCLEFQPVKYPSPCQSPGKSSRHHPPSPRTNHSFLFKREPPDGAEVVPLLNESTSKDDSFVADDSSLLSHIEIKEVMIENQSVNMTKQENTFTPSPNSLFKQTVRYKPTRPKENNDADHF
jgi:hypothetical protein